jgi:hypothetical protein
LGLADRGTHGVVVHPASGSCHRANQNVPSWSGDEVVEKHPAAWAATEGAYFGLWGAVAGAVIGGAVVLKRRCRR